MCRSRSVGVGTVVVDVEPARVESDTHAGVDASLQPLRTADFVLQLVSVLLILLFLTLALYIAYKRRRLLKMKRFSDFGTQTDAEVGAREDLDRVIKAVSSDVISNLSDFIEQLCQIVLTDSYILPRTNTSTLQKALLGNQFLPYFKGRKEKIHSFL